MGMIKNRHTYLTPRQQAQRYDHGRIHGQDRVGSEANWEMVWSISGDNLNCYEASTLNMVGQIVPEDIEGLKIQMRIVARTTDNEGAILNAVFSTYFDESCQKLADKQRIYYRQPPGLSNTGAKIALGLPIHLYCPIVRNEAYPKFRIKLDYESNEAFHNHFAIVQYFNPYLS